MFGEFKLATQLIANMLQCNGWLLSCSSLFSWVNLIRVNWSCGDSWIRIFNHIYIRYNIDTLYIIISNILKGSEMPWTHPQRAPAEARAGACSAKWRTGSKGSRLKPRHLRSFIGELWTHEDMFSRLEKTGFLLLDLSMMSGSSISIASCQYGF